MRMKNVLLILILSGFSLGSYAGETHPVLETDRENVALARLSVILDHLTPFIEEAKRYQNSNARVQFRYDWLQEDIQQIKAGIQAKFHSSSIEARRIPPIRGDYVIFKRKAT